ncbi:MAG: sodium:solute symporter, partial [Pseudomonadota bacterium]|nr:sodium:solute symporter [Pseudomonadota bacterium]
IWKEYVNPEVSGAGESQIAKIASLVVKVGALFFIIFMPQQYAINLQLLGGIWIIQTLPSVLIGLYTRWLNSVALLIGWAVGLGTGTAMAYAVGFKAIYALHLFGITIPCYAALATLILNVGVSFVLSAVFNLFVRGGDATAAADYT